MNLFQQRPRSRLAAMFPAISPRLTWETGTVSYVGRNVFQITGVDARARYVLGTDVYTINGKAAVLDAVYVGGNTIVYLADAICYSSMTTVGRSQLYDGLVNLCTGGTPICSSTWSGGSCGGSSANAFDGLYTTAWVGSEYGPVTNNSWIGYAFATSQAITAIDITQGPPFNLGGYAGGVTSINLRYSDNGSSWTSVGTFNLPGDCLTCRIITPAPAAAHIFWACMAASDTNPSGERWSVLELKMAA